MVVVVVVLSGGGKVTVPDESGKTLSAAQSDLQAHHLAAHLRAQGIGPETLVALLAVFIVGGHAYDAASHGPRDSNA